MPIDLTDLTNADWDAINAAVAPFATNSGSAQVQVLAAVYRAGLAAGRARAIEEADSLRAEANEANEVLRSAYQIADRLGQETNWAIWKDRLDAILLKQHRRMYPITLDAARKEGK